ncbi:MAG TPA: acetyl-CoA carboxylase biotin carboxyl carrier protein [Gemmatimonadaceae bacterium]|nr:acetyl-CoA carboxylase biotin carboxyl carrier protein [Gemmatimonadaceae bacterium]
MIDLRYVKKLVDMLDGSSVDSIEISTEKGVRIRIAKTSQQRQFHVAAPAPAQAAPVAADPAAPASAAAPAPPPPREPERVQLLEVKSPMVGTFYSAPEPGGTPYVAVGDRIRRGQVLCIIEAMKIMNELESEVEGVVKEISTQDAHPVEYGQVLFRVDPHG